MASNTCISVGLSPLAPSPAAANGALRFRFTASGMGSSGTIVYSLHGSSNANVLVATSRMGLGSTKNTRIDAGFGSRRGVHITFIIGHGAKIAGGKLIFVCIGNVYYKTIGCTDASGFADSGVVHVNNARRTSIRLGTLQFCGTTLDSSRILGGCVLCQSAASRVLSVCSGGGICRRKARGFSMSGLTTRYPIVVFANSVPALRGAASGGRAVCISIRCVGVRRPTESFGSRKAQLHPRKASSVNCPGGGFHPCAGCKAV